MAESVYRVTELVGVSSESWEAAARNAIETAAKSCGTSVSARLTASMSRSRTAR